MDNQKATLELGTKPVGQLLVRYAVPAIIAMTASSLYNMVDSIFIGQGVGALAISGLAITFPLMNLSTAFGAGVGVGASSLLSVKLGQKDYEAAQNILGNTVVLNIITGVCFPLSAFCFSNPSSCSSGQAHKHCRTLRITWRLSFLETLLRTCILVLTPCNGRQASPNCLCI